MTHGLLGPQSLADDSLNEVVSVLHSQGSELAGTARIAILALLETLEGGLEGNLPAAYHLASIDPGIGKSLSVSAFLRTWKARGFTPAAGVLIALPRLEEIKAYVDRSGLNENEYAVLTSDRDMNALGNSDKSSAPVLFTTQQMVQRRVQSADTFSELRQFHFRGQPRALRIWDETMLPEEGEVLHVDQLGLIPALLSRWKPEFARKVRELHHEAMGLAIGDELAIPATIAEGAPQEGEKQADAVKGVVRQLRLLGGKTLTVADDGHMGTALIGGGLPFPDDFRPAIILDASGRIRPTYGLWERHRGGLVRLPAAVNDYKQLEIRLWQRGSGKVSLVRAGVQQEIAEAVAAEITREDDGGEWLIVTYKGQEGVADAVKELVAHAGKIKVLTWGRHHATNAFADVRNVVLVGQPTYAAISYKALACAASGLSPAALEDHVDLEDVQWGEYQHHLLQALCRASVRRSRNGLAGACRAWIVGTPSAHTEGRIRDAFPGCRLFPWEPIEKPLSEKAAAAIAFLTEWFARGDQDVPKRELREHLGMTPSNFSRDVLDLAEFKDYLREAGLSLGHHKIAKAARVAFEPYSPNAEAHQSD